MPIRRSGPTFIAETAAAWMVLASLCGADEPRDKAANPPAQARPAVQLPPRPVPIRAVQIRPQVVVQPGRSQAGVPPLTTPPTDPSVSRRLDEAKQLLANGQIDRGLQLIQAVLDQPSASFLREEVKPSDENPSEPVPPPAPERWIPASRVAEGLVENGPPGTLMRYRELHEHEAAHLLSEADKRRDPAAWGDVSRRFYLTRAGSAAVDRLASYNLDLGRAALALVYFDRLVSSKVHREDLPEVTRMKRAAAMALLGGDSPPPSDVPVSLGGETVTTRLWMARFRKDAIDTLRSDGVEVNIDSTMDSMPLLSPDWQSPLVKDKEIEERRVADVVEENPSRNLPILFGYDPLVISDRVFFRDFDGTWVFDISTGKRVGEIRGTSTISREISRLDPRWGPSAAIPGADYYTFLANQVYGSMTTDGRRVYLVDDLTLNPSPFQLQAIRNQPNENAADTRRNSIRAWDARTFAHVWTVGGKSSRDTDASAAYFLGPPVEIEGLLYVVGEARSEICLFAIDPEVGSVLWKEVLAVSGRIIETDLFRRSQVCHLVYSDGILICPTNLFHVVAVDPKTRVRLWEYSMVGDGPIAVQYAMMASQAIITPPGAIPADRPRIAGGRVILSESLGGSFHCVDLQSGRPIWRADRGRDWYVAGVFGDRILTVGPDRVRGIGLFDGREIWSKSIGPPSGRGLRLAKQYLLPMADGRVLAIDPSEGRVVARASSRVRQPIGSLTLGSGRVFAAGPSGLVAYSLVRDVRKDVEQWLAADANNPRGLYRRAQLSLSENKISQAIVDLRTAVRGTADPESIEKSRKLLFDVAANEALQSPDQIGPLAADLEKLATNIHERGIHYRLTAEHRLRIGEYQEAIDAIDRHKALGLTAFVPTETPSVKRSPAVWERSFLTRMNAAAGPKADAEIAAILRRRLSDAAESGDLDKVRTLASDLAGVRMGGDVRLAFAQKLSERKQFAEAEQVLLEATQANDRTVVARAFQNLADLAEKEGRLAEARFYLTSWARRMPTPDGLASQTPADQIAQFDQRHPSVAAPWEAYAWDFDRVVTKNDKAFRPDTNRRILFPFESGPPFFRNWLISFDQQRWEVEFQGRGSGIVEWKLAELPKTLNYAQEMKYRQLGSLMFFTQADTIYAISGLERRLVWSRQFENPSTETVRVVTTNARVRIVARSSVAYGGGAVMWPALQSVGPGFLAVRIGKSLRVLDPWTGRDLWVREDMAAGDTVIGDAEALLVLGANDQFTAYRTLDGRAVGEGALGPELRYRKSYVGRRVLLFQRDDPHRHTVRLYDPWKKVDFWAHAFPATTEWHFADDQRIVLVDREQSFTILDIQTGEVIIKDSLTRDSAKPNEATPAQLQIFADNQNYYVTAQRNIPGQNIWPVSPSPNLKTMQVHGWIRAYERQSKKHKWTREMLNRTIVTSPGEELPVLLAIGNRMVDLGNNRKKLATSLDIIDKRDGNLVYTEDHDQYGTMLELASAASERWIELRGFNLRIRLDFVKKGENVEARQTVSEEASTRAMRGMLDRVRAQREKKDREK